MPIMDKQYFLILIFNILLISMLITDRATKWTLPSMHVLFGMCNAHSEISFFKIFKSKGAIDILSL